MKFSQLAEWTLDAAKKTGKLPTSVVNEDHINSYNFLVEFYKDNEPFLKQFNIDTYKFAKCILIFCKSIDEYFFKNIFTAFKSSKTSLEPFLLEYQKYISNNF